MVASRRVITDVIRVFRSAAEANRATAARRGNLIALTSDQADELVVAADLHGHRLNFRRLVQSSRLEDPRRHLVMHEVCHGGPLYPGGSGCMSHLLLEDVAQLKVRFAEQFHFLMSNHELAELTDFPITKSNRVLNLLFRGGLREMYGEAVDDVRAAMNEFLSTCPLAVRTEGGAFICHAVPEQTDRDGFDVTVFDRPLTPADLQVGGAVHRLVWGRDVRGENGQAFARLVDADVIVQGHVPCEDGFWVPNEYQVILDCCGQRACYLVLPVAQRLTQHQVVQRIRRLDRPAAAESGGDA